MPNYKSKMLTFLSVGEMSSMLLDSTDEDGILFAVATDSTNFKIVMWRKTSTATVDNELVYPANGPGRWHVLPNGPVDAGLAISTLNDLTDVNITPSLASGDILRFDGAEWINQAMALGGSIIQFGEYNTTGVPLSQFVTGTRIPLPQKEEGKSILIMRVGAVDHPVQGWKPGAIRYVVYHWSLDDWRIVAYSNIRTTPTSGSYQVQDPPWAGEAPGQVFVNTIGGGTENYIFLWTGTTWKRMAFL